MWTYMCTNACMYAHMIECVNRVGVPSSVRDSQQPFLVLDGAVRMHWLVLSFGREGMYSSIRKWKDETWKVSSSIRRDISFTKKGRVDLQTYRIWQGEALWAIPSVLDTGTKPGVQKCDILLWRKTVFRLKFKRVVGSFCKQWQQKLVFITCLWGSVWGSTCWNWHECLESHIHSCSRLLSCSVFWDKSRPACHIPSQLYLENALNCQVTPIMCLWTYRTVYVLW